MYPMAYFTKSYVVKDNINYQTDGKVKTEKIWDIVSPHEGYSGGFGGLKTSESSSPQR